MVFNYMSSLNNIFAWLSYLVLLVQTLFFFIVLHKLQLVIARGFSYNEQLEHLFPSSSVSLIIPGPSCQEFKLSSCYSINYFYVVKVHVRILLYWSCVLRWQDETQSLNYIPLVFKNVMFQHCVMLQKKLYTFRESQAIQ